MKINFIDLQAQYKAYEQEINKEVLEVMASAQFIGGQQISTLEKNLAQFCETKEALACSSGTDALLLALMALDIKEGDEVITTPFTFIATAEVIAFLKATPVFVDIDETTYNIDHTKIEEKITSKTKAIIPVSLYGQTANMDEINAIASKHNLCVIEDACQSFGAEYKGKKSCNLSHIGCTSFFPSKPLGCYGDGGAIMTNDENLASKMRMILNHGQNERYSHRYIGINGRLDAIQAAILNVKMKHFDKEVEARAKIGQKYINELKDAKGVTPPTILEDRTSVFAQFTLLCENREELQAKLNEASIPTAIHYPKPLHLQEVFEYLGYKKGDFPISERVSQQVISLPMSPFLTQEEQDYIIKTIKG
ncbi:aminotransferase DegT [Halarcobacter ebronensis]|uniref:Aminotransferase DegT n=1 Tax=Halarcobacter ebronensis TaxID=1462615 RepID=A0A4Q0YAC0_9BACT|nr:DegT/DnrJ/EryC1/StrS family aminotransferase [Halarcobacter ebronensis]RXJ66845.1 aminotransferase DegT [Halarcobacter ebronensis]